MVATHEAAASALRCGDRSDFTDCRPDGQVSCPQKAPVQPSAAALRQWPNSWTLIRISSPCGEVNPMCSLVARRCHCLPQPSSRQHSASVLLELWRSQAHLLESPSSQPVLLMGRGVSYELPTAGSKLTLPVSHHIMAAGALEDELLLA